MIHGRLPGGRRAGGHGRTLAFATTAWMSPRQRLGQSQPPRGAGAAAGPSPSTVPVTRWPCPDQGESRKSQPQLSPLLVLLPSVGETESSVERTGDGSFTSLLCWCLYMKYVCVCSVVPTLCDPWTVAHQATLSMGFSG